MQNVPATTDSDGDSTITHYYNWLLSFIISVLFKLGMFSFLLLVALLYCAIFGFSKLYYNGEDDWHFFT